MKETVGIVGLGRMGMPTAKVLMKAGYRVVGFARRPEVIDEFVSMGGEQASDYKTVAQKAKTVILFVLNDAQVIEVITGPNGLLSGCTPGSTIICMATINKDNLEWVAGQCADGNVGFVDLPCTGGPARIEAGTLTMIAGAPKALLDKCRPILDPLGTIVHVGEKPGMGQAVKHCNQLLVATTHAAVMEIVLMARKQGLDLAQVGEVIGSGIAGSDYFKLLYASVVGEATPPGGLGQMCKDINIVVNSGRRLKIPLLVATAANQYFMAAESLGLENEESSALFQVVKGFSEADR